MDEMFEMLGIAVAAIVLVIVSLVLCAAAGEVVKCLHAVVAQRRQDRETRRKALPVLPEAGREYWVHFPAAEGYELACYTGAGRLVPDEEIHPGPGSRQVGGTDRPFLDYLN